MNQTQQNLLEWSKQESSLKQDLPAFSPISNDNDRENFDLEIIPNLNHREQAKNDLEQAIKDQYHTKSKDFNGLLYKGAEISEEDFSSLKENQDKEIEIHGFLSVSKEKDIALNFMETDPNKKVFITIIVPKGPNEEEQGFAEIEEKEVLFNIKSRFTVLETEDEYSQDLSYRHLVLLYGAHGFRKFVTERNPIHEISIKERNFEISEKLLFLSIKSGLYYEKEEIDNENAPFLCIPPTMEKSNEVKINGCLLRMTSNEERIPFYGYKCSKCQAKRQKSYFICTDCCGKKWCENCFEGEPPACLTAKHKILLETSPFSFWCEKNQESKEKIEDNSKFLVNPMIESSNEKEIIIKCSIEEMMKGFFKDYVIVWHDPDVENHQQYIEQLTKFCEVATFTEWEKAKDYIQNTQTVCHVVTNGELLVKEIFEKENVSNIYVFCENKEENSDWIKNYPKISCVEKDIQKLINQIQQDLLQWYKKASSLKLNLPAFAPIFNDSDKSQMNNLHRYLKIIPNFKNREQAKEDLLNLSKVIYTDPNNQKLIADFEANYNGYNKEQILRWYTIESFLYKVTNNCLRIATSDSIQYCRLLLQDIEQAIKDQYQQKSKEFNGLLYRGAYMSEQEWSNLKDNQDKEIEMHGFLSVSKIKNIGLHFMEDDPSKKVFVTIIVPAGPDKEEQGFAEMHQYSQYPQEKEILFNVRSRFTVLEAEDDYEYSAGSKCRHLVLLYGARGFRKYATKNATKVTIGNVGAISCAHCQAQGEKLFFYSMADGQDQENCYCKTCVDHGRSPFLYIPTTENKFVAEVNGALLINSNQHQIPFYGYKCCVCQAKRKKQYFMCTDCNGKKWCENCFEEEAVTCLQANHSLVLETSPYTFWSEKMSENEFAHLRYQNSSVRKGPDVFQQAEMYTQTNEHEKALEYYKLYIEENEAKGKDHNLATAYNNIGLIYQRQRKYKEALKYNLKSLEIEEALDRNDNHQTMANTYNNIGIIYVHQKEYDKAAEICLKSLDLLKTFYGNDNHPRIASLYHNIGGISLQQKKSDKALEYYWKAIEIRKSHYGDDNHPGNAASYNNIAGIYENQKDYNSALKYFLISLDILKTIHGDNHSSTETSYNNIAAVYRNQGEYEKALEYYLKSMEITKSVFGDNHINVGNSYGKLANIYNHLGEHNKSLEYYSKSLEIKKSVNGDEHSSTIETQEKIKEIQLIIDQYKSQ